MVERKSISKKLRFEVFKRDKFACQYCGRKSPDVILQVDHIEPVIEGGTNDILNLITSCFDCNNGKGARRLDDSTVLTKQQKELEQLQERRDQIEMMIEWRRELNLIEDETLDKIVAYVDEKLTGKNLNENGRATVAQLVDKIPLDEILEAVDISARQYLRYDNEGNCTKESTENFISKISGIIYNRRKSPIDQKISYIKGIGRNRFHYWNEGKASAILSDYVIALRTGFGWTDEQILSDLDEELMPETKNAANWSQWRDLVEHWINDIYRQRD